MTAAYDFIVIGGGSAGCTVAARLVEQEAGSVLLVEAGPRDTGLTVRMPLGLVRLMGSRRDWRYRSTPQAGLGGRSLAIPRGRLLGGSASINSMVWLRGRRDDFDGWSLDGWRWRDVEPVFEAIEARMTPARLADPHPLSDAFQSLFGGNGLAPPTPERASGGVFHFNMRRGRRWSPADAFVRPAQRRGLTVVTGAQVARLRMKNGRAHGVVFAEGSEAAAARGVVVSAGAIGSPEILIRSGIGPAADVAALGIQPLIDAPEVGANLHDHPAAGLYHVGPRAGYGLASDQIGRWLAAPFRWVANGTGPLGSPTVEAGAFFNAGGDDGAAPDIQVHFMPWRRDWTGRQVVRGSGYFADVCVCRPRSRGRLRVTPQGTEIDFALFSDPDDLDRLVAGWQRLRTVMAMLPFGANGAPEAFPGGAVRTEEQVRAHIVATAATAFHPVGTLRMGPGDAPVDARCRVRGVEGLWVADASLMPAITSANTNAPSMMIGWRAADFIAADAR